MPSNQYRRFSDKELLEAMDNSEVSNSSSLMDEFFYRLNLASERSVSVASLKELDDYIAAVPQAERLDILLAPPRINEEIVDWGIKKIEANFENAAKGGFANNHYAAAIVSDRVMANELLAQRMAHNKFPSVSPLEFANSCAVARSMWCTFDETVSKLEEATVKDSDKSAAFEALQDTGLVSDLRNLENARSRYDQCEKLVGKGALNSALYRIAVWFERNAAERADLCRQSGYEDIEEVDVLKIDQINESLLSA